MRATCISLSGLGKQLFLCCSILLLAAQTQAQVTGTRTIGTDYPTLSAAITDLNTSGISGAVTINVPAGFAETAPAGGYLLGSTILNASTSATSTLTIRKTGSGANPLLTAPTGTSTSTDGIFFIQGTDYVTIDGLNLSESVANTTATTWMEWGYALVKLQNVAPFDGCNHTDIQNCTITLNRLNTPTVGIYSGNHIATATTALSITAPADAMNNCRFYSNTVLNSVTGISLRGFAAATPYTLYDQGNDIGGSSAATGNTIQNYCGATSGAAVNLQYQNNANVAYNSIDNILGGGVASTSILYGIYAQNGTNASVTVTNNNIHLTHGTTGSALYGVNISCVGTGSVDVNSNTISATGGSTGTMYMIYLGGANANVTTNSNRFYNINVANSGSLYLVYHNTAATPENITCNNNFTDGTTTPYVSKTGTGGTVAGYYNNSGSGSGVTTLNNNDFSNFTLAGSPTFYGIFENDGGTGQIKSARNNKVSNITAAGGTLYGVYMGYSASEIFSGNTVFQLNAGTGAAYGIYIGSSSNADTVINNHVHDLTSTGGNVYGIGITSGSTVHVYQDTVNTLAAGGTSGLAYGIYQTGGTTVNIFKDRIYDLSSAGTGGSAYGLYLTSGTVSAFNNLVGDIRTPNYNGAGGTQLAGIYISGGTAHNIYYNTVHLNATSTGTDFGSSAIYASTTPAVTLRNNIFVNRSTPVGAGLTTVYRRSGPSLATYQPASNNNLFFAGSPGASRVIYYDGTTPYTTLASYKTLVSPRDANSVTELPPFLSVSGASPDFLHIDPAMPTQVESGAINIAGITTDYHDNIRAGNPGYAGTGSTPDIGAVEGEYIPTDLSAPAISYTALPAGCSTGDRTFSATITDATGVPVSGAFMPRVYFRKGAGPWSSTAGTLTSGSGTSGTWSFTISAAAMGGLTTGDVVSYFVIAQDEVATPFISANPGAGLVASDVNTITTYPTTPNTYSILPVLSGTYNVGVGMPYTTITSAVNAYNASCVSGNVVFQLTDPAYPSETFPITINNNGSAGGGNRLTIMPAAGVSPVVSGSGTPAVFVLNGADYVTIDGSNAPLANSVCPAVSSGRNMTIENTSTSTTTAVVWIQTTTGGDSATHNTIRNCNIKGSGNTQTLFGVGSGGTTVGYTSSGTNNNSNIIENNRITATQTGICSRGASATNKNTGTIINQNLLNGTAPDNQRNNGIFVGFEDGINIAGNQIANITNSISNDIIGINLGFANNSTSSTSTTGSDVTNATVSNNKLDELKQTNTYTCLGIAVAGVATGVNTIANNMVSGVLSNGTGGDFSAGIFIGGTTGGATKVYYNAVNMTGTLTGASYPSFAIAVSGSNPIVELKNNIFVNNASTGSPYIYAIGLAYSAYTNLSSDRNDFYSVGANMGTVGSLAGTGTDQPTLAAWQTTTGQDANSQNVNPVFASASDLHLVAAAENIPLLDAGTPVPVTTDYDCAARSTTPDIGLNEFTIPLCGSVTVGTVAPVIPAFCNSGSTTINITGSTVGVGISYQWQSSSDSVSWSAIPGATSLSYVTPTIGTTTFYRVVLRCSFSGLSDSATTKVTIYPLPVITVSPDGGSICTTGTGLNMTASGAASYTWAPGAGLSATTGAAVNANPTASATYTITGTDVHGCVNTHAVNITVSTPPDTFSITPSSVTMCPGSAPVLLTATGAVTPASGPASVTSGAISLTIPDATASGVVDSLIMSGIPASATVTNVSVGFNINMTYDGDLTLNLTAPNGNTLNLVNRRGAGGDDFVNTIVSSAGGLLFSAGTAPFTDIFSADAATTGGTTGLPVTTSSWGDLYSMLNGKWKFSARDWAGGDVGSITSWTLTIDYTYNPTLIWSPVTGLYTDAGGTAAYAGASSPGIYAAPSDTTTYVATLAVGACSVSKSVTVNVIPLPDAGTISGPAGVCTGGSVTLSASTPGGTWLSSTPAVATIRPATGIVSGITAGVDTIKYIVTNTCGADTTIKIITVDLAPFAGSIIGPSVVCEGATVVLSATAPGGVWSSSNARATVSSTGLVTGASAGPVVISYTVTNSCGTAVATRAMTVNPAPDAGAISGPLAVCEAASITLSASAPGGVWSSVNGNATVSGTGVVTGIAEGTDTIRYIVTNSCGADTAEMFITINPAPNAGLIAGPIDVCTGSSITLTDTTSGGVWSASNPHASVSSGVVTGVSAGIDTISYAVSNMCGTATVTYVVTVIAVPDAGTIGGPSSVCTADSITLTSTTPGGTWGSSMGSVATVSASGVVTGVSTGTTIINYTVTNICGTDNAVRSVVVNQSPALFTVTGGGAYCSGRAGLPIGLSGSETDKTYQLYIGSASVGAPIPGTGGALDFGLQTAGGTYTVVAFNPAGGCSRTMSGTASIFINPIVPPTVSITAPSLSVCAGSAITLTAVPVNGGATPTYQWQVNGVNAATGVSYTYVPANGDVVRVIIRSSPCAVPDTGSASVIINVQAYVAPAVSITASPATILCTGTPVTFTAHPVNGGSSPSFLWTRNGINVATGPTYTFVPATGDNVYVRLTSDFACRIGDTALSNHIIMTVSSSAVPSLSIVAHPGTVIHPGQSDTLVATLVNGGPSPTYQWYINGVAIPGATMATYISAGFVNADIVTCKVVTSGPCSIGVISDSVTIAVVPTGIEEVNAGKNDIRILPNPNKGSFVVKGTLASATDEEVQIEITNMLGQVVYEDKLMPQNGALSGRIQMSGTIASGMYLLTLHTTRGNIVFHVVVEQ